MERNVFEEKGGTYTMQGDHCLPDLLALPPEEKRPVGIWGQRYKRYLQQHHEILCYDLLTLQRSVWG